MKWIWKFILQSGDHCVSPQFDNKIASSKKKAEARVCVSNAFVTEDNTFKLCFFVVEDEQVTEEADMLMWI